VGELVNLEERKVILFEGPSRSLNERLTFEIERSSSLKIYVSALTQLNIG